jgi:hypothetical protein
VPSQYAVGGSDNITASPIYPAPWAEYDFMFGSIVKGERDRLGPGTDKHPAGLTMAYNNASSAASGGQGATSQSGVGGGGGGGGGSVSTIPAGVSVPEATDLPTAVPDTGSTWSLFGLALLAIAGFRYFTFANEPSRIN